ncbi:MAG TPA: TolC family protein [Spirochaetota bacterium]|nr:TolC family protein [Spirochaetota bacterium]
MHKQLRIGAVLGIICLLPGGALPVSGEEMSATGAEKTATITIAGHVITLERAIDLVLRNNLTLQSAKYNVIMSDSDYERFSGKFSPSLNLEGGYANQKSPPTGMSAFTGDRQYQYDASASISKLFSSGTTISAGVKEVFFDANDPGVPAFGIEKTPAYHKPSLFVSLQQELLRNAFGRGDRLQKEMLNSAAQMQRAAIINELSGLVVSTLIDYWTITVQKSAVENARLELESARQVRDIIARNARYGLGELYDLNQYNALVASSEAGLDAAAQRHREAVRKLVRTMNMPADTKVEGVTDLVDALPALDEDAAVKTAFEKRVDYRNARLMLENADRELGYHKNNALPSLVISMGLNTLGQDENYSPAMRDTASAKYPSWEARAKLTYPLDDRELKVNLRNAELRRRQAAIDLDRTKLEVRDDVLNSLERVRLLHSSLGKARTARSESELYYQRLLARFRQGKATAVNVKFALDALVQARQGELEALVQYNVTLLGFDLAKNEIFDRYNVDVEKYIRVGKE